MNYYFDVLKKYAIFKGRTQRKNYWYFVLINIIIGTILQIIDSLIDSQGLIYELYGLATLVPILALTVRRLHDTNQSGWWIISPIVFAPLGFFVSPLLVLLPFILLIVLLAKSGDVGDNNFGPDPKN